MDNTNFEKLLEGATGEFGRYQKLHLILLMLPACLLHPYTNFALVMLTYEPPHMCNEQPPSDLPMNKTWLYLNESTAWVVEPQQCDIKATPANGSMNPNGSATETFRCRSSWVYDQTLLQSTVVTEWNLVCDRAIYATIVTNILFACSGLGLLTFSTLQDRIGRKPVLLITSTLVIIGNIGASFTADEILFTIVRGLADFGGVVIFSNCYIWMLEILGPTKRTLGSVVLCSAFAIGTSSLSAVAYLAATWRNLCRVISVPLFLIYGYYWPLYESPRWLYSRGRYAESLQVLRRIRSINKDIAPSDMLFALETHLLERADAGEATDGPKAGVTYSALSLLKPPNLRRKTLLLAVGFVANSIVYIGIAFNTKNLGGNFLITFALQAAIEMPAVLINLLILNRFGRVPPLVSLLILSGLSCFACTLAYDYAIQWLLILFTVLAKFFICVSYAVIYQLATETFPTQARASGIGLLNLISATANLLTPYIVHSAHYHQVLPMVIIGGIAVVAGTVTLLIPETRGKTMPDTVAYAETHGKANIQTAALNARRIITRQ